MPQTKHFPITLAGALLILLFLFSFTGLVAQPPAGYYSSATGSGAILKTNLYNIIKGHTVRSYTQLWTDFQQTDKKSNGKVYDMYGYGAYEYTFVTQQCGSYNSENDCYNREHSFPASWFNDASPMYSDLFHLYPTDGYVNGMRSNYPYGEVSSASWTSDNGSKRGSNSYPGYTGTVFEPIDEFKGDFARTYFYMATRYENVIGSWYANDANANAVLQNNSFPVFEDWFKNMLGEWHVNDPVSQKEIDRNNAVYGIQGNRNPFIDNPNYVYQIWGVGQMTVVTEPLNHATNISPWFIDLNWVDATGADLPAGYLIRYSTVSFNAIQDPVDGTVYSSISDVYAIYGVQHARIQNLAPSTTYYFKLFPYTGAGANINYKTTGDVPAISKITGE